MLGLVGCFIITWLPACLTSNQPSFSKRFVKTIEDSGYNMNDKETELYQYLKKISQSEQLVPIDRLFEITEPRKVYLDKV